MKKRKPRSFKATSHKAYCFLVATYLLVSTALQAQTLTTLYSFTGENDGAMPQSPLVLSGNILYGGAMFGGANGQGTIFKMNTDGTGFTTLYSFTDSPVDGFAGNPYGPLAVSQGAIYGTASGEPLGTVFKINTDGSGQSILHIFSGGLDGDDPFGGVILSGNTLYGTTSDGGNVFQVNTDGTGFLSLHCLSCETNVRGDDSAIYGGVVFVGNSLCGTVIGGGSNNAGTLFKVNMDGSGFMTLHEFKGSDGSGPWSGLLLYSNKLYGTTTAGGGNNSVGGLFAINPDGTGFTNLHVFTGYDGGRAQGGLICSGNVLYGTLMNGGGVGAAGVVFSLNTDGTGFKKLYVFSGGADGGAPDTALTMSGNNLYGTTTTGGAYNNGSVFRLTLPAVPAVRATASINLSRTNVVLAWPVTSTMFTLRSSTNLIDWAPVTQTPQQVNGQYTVTNPISGDRQFFRLSQ